jgi:hypothetical protein
MPLGKPILLILCYNRTRSRAPQPSDQRTEPTVRHYPRAHHVIEPLKQTDCRSIALRNNLATSCRFRECALLNLNTAPSCGFSSALQRLKQLYNQIGPFLYLSPPGNAPHLVTPQPKFIPRLQPSIIQPIDLRFVPKYVQKNPLNFLFQSETMTRPIRRKSDYGEVPIKTRVQ